MLQNKILVRASGLATLNGMNDSLVIGSDEEMNVEMAFVDCEQKAQLDRNELGPSNVTAILVPTWGEGPRVPLSVEYNADAPRGRGIYPKLNRRKRGWSR
jgi:hypothetical protein